MKVIISNGVHRFHLSAAASELEDLGVLSKFITAGYPGATIKLLFGNLFFKKNNGINRLLDREESNIPHGKIYAIWSAEVVTHFGVLIGKKFKNFLITSKINRISFKVYALLAAVEVAISKANVYHYRAGFGGFSVRVAKWKKMTCICDHSAVSPGVFDYLINNAGKNPTERNTKNISDFWLWIEKDMKQADHIIVNSDFVKETMIFDGWKESNISVIYLGLDNKYISELPTRQENCFSNKIIYAGRVSKSKGFDLVVETLKIIDYPWELTVAGGIDPDISSEYKTFLSDPRVKVCGVVSRKKLAVLFSESDILFFPSLAEGSARVIFEAMAAGCYIVTTKNSGSIVESGVNGQLIEPGNIEQAVDAINYAFNNIETISTIKNSNSKYTRSNFSQAKYGENLVLAYKNLLGQSE